MRPAATPFPRIAAIGLLVVVGAAFLVLAWPRIHAPFGDSDEGINGAVWALDSRALRELGPVDSALGGRRADGTKYATHPPMLVVTTALAETVAGEREAATRAAAWVGALASIALLYRLLRRTGADPLPAAGGVAVACTTPMFLTYGPMLDTPVTAFPFGVALVLVWWRDWQARTPGKVSPTGATSATAASEPAGDGPAPWLVVLAAALACLASWQSALLVAILVASFAIRAWRDRPTAAASLRAAVPYVVGGAVGVGLSLGWTWWAHDGLGVLTDKFLRRSGTEAGVGFGDLVAFQVPWIFNLLGLAVIGLAGCVAALWDERIRPLAAVSLAVTFGYAVVFREAAAGHQYWLYWELLPTAVGATWLLGRLHRDLRSSGVAVQTGVVLGLCVLVGAFNLARPDNARPLIERGHRVAALVIGQPPTTDELVYVGEEFRPDPWVRYHTGRRSRFLTSADEVAALAGSDPSTPVLLLGQCGTSDPSSAFCRRAHGQRDDGGGAPAGEARFVTAAELQARLGGT